MKFKIRPILSQRQLLRAKFSMAIAAVICVITIGSSMVGQVEANEKQPFKDDKQIFNFDESDFKVRDIVDFERGRIVYYGMNE
jgi:hypothetical protein